MVSRFFPVLLAVLLSGLSSAQEIEPNSILVESAQTSLIQNTKIAAPLSGIVAAVHVTEGELLAVGTPLVELRSEMAQRELEAARSALEAATLKSENDVNLRYAQRTLQVRENEMKQSQIANETYAGAVSAMELEELALQVDQAALAIEQAKQELLIAHATTNEKAATVEIAQDES